MTAARDVYSGYIKCSVCGGYGYVFMRDGNKGQQQCPSCKGDKISRDPRHKKLPPVVEGELELP